MERFRFYKIGHLLSGNGKGNQFGKFIYCVQPENQLYNNNNIKIADMFLFPLPDCYHTAVTVKLVTPNQISPKKTSQERLGGAELLLGLGHQLEGLGLVVGHDDEEGEEGVLLCNELSEGFGERFPSLHNS